MMTDRQPLDELTYQHRQGLASGIPLGGLGTGSVELRDDGRFHDWEIFNNYIWSGSEEDAPPQMWSEDAFFAVRCRPENGSPRVRLLYHDDVKSKAVCSRYHHAVMYNYPFLRYVDEITYRGSHPFARLRYEDAEMPLELRLEAFTPFIPHNARDSGLPLAFFVFEVRNRGQKPCEASLMFSLRNCVGYDQDSLDLNHRIERTGELTLIRMGEQSVDPSARTAGSMALGVLGEGVSFMPAWTDGRGMKGFEVVTAPALSQLFYPFRDDGELAGEEETWERTVERREPGHACGELHYTMRQFGWRWRGALCRKLHLQPGQRERVVFLMSWHFPNHYHYFARDVNLGHMYENWFSDAADVASYGGGNFDRLHGESRCFSDNLHEGTLPGWLTDSLAAQLTTFPQSFWWTRSGDLAVWEGSGCCQTLLGAQTIWSSWQPVMFFPELYMEMSRRMAAFQPPPEEGDESLAALKWRRRNAQQQERRDAFGGWFSQRYEDLGYSREDFQRRSRPRPNSGLWAGAPQLLRDYLWTGDAEYLRRLWPIVKGRIEARIDADENGDGLPDGRICFTTYDHWFPPATNCYRCTLWLSQLKAAARIAALLGEDEEAAHFRKVLQKGARSFEELLWNGEYYDFCYDPLKDENDAGCLADQVSGQLYARLCGLGTVHPEQHVRSALQAVHRHNRRPEEGLLNGADPEGRDDWRYFARFSATGEDEALAGQWVTPWTGTEYYVAAVMAAEGLAAQALDVARDVYERQVKMGMLYNHIECGEHYFRPMALWAILPALQGLCWDAATGRLDLAPDPGSDLDSVLVLPTAWGRLRASHDDEARCEIAVTSGELKLRTIEVTLGDEPAELEVCVDEARADCAWSWKDGFAKVELDQPACLRAGNRLAVRAVPAEGRP